MLLKQNFTFYKGKFNATLKSSDSLVGKYAILRS